MHAHIARLAVVFCFLPGLAFAWFNDDWASRKQFSIDASITGADIKEPLADFPMLVRLHTGNFGFFADLSDNGEDLRFMADDKTPVKFHIEKFDKTGEIALAWVKVPKVQGGATSDSFWMYYGNGSAQAGSEPGATYDANFVAVFHFGDAGNPFPQDATAYANHAAESKAVIDPAGWIGGAAKFNGDGRIGLNPSPSMALTPESGYTFSAWLKIDAAQTSALVFQAAEFTNKLELAIQGEALSGSFGAARTPLANLTLGKWQHVALVLAADHLELFLDGQSVGSVPVVPKPMNPTISLGGSAAGQFLTGYLDEVQISNKARAADWIKFSVRCQSPDFTILNQGEDESKGSGEGINYFVVILQNVTVDGWVVIGLTGIMLVVAIIVIVTKSLVISRVKKDNAAFLAQYESLDMSSDPGQLDQDESAEEKDLADSDLLTALVGKHDHFQSSTLYHVYHAGVREVKKRIGDTTKPITPEALNVVRVRIDSAIVRESQKLNANMVLLTIAIAGGPFLGLLGTVVGVMITFAAIAATGDVNINSIAPGIAAALAATVAGLAVAIPALFGYNYLLTQIKDIVADMRVFSDEFLALLSERIADKQRGD